MSLLQHRLLSGSPAAPAATTSPAPPSSAAAIFIGALVKLGLRRSPRLDGPSDEWIVWMSRSAMLIGGGAVLFSVLATV